MKRAVILFVLGGGLLLPAWAQEKPAPDPLDGAREARDTAEDLEILRALNAVGLTNTQLQRLLPVLEDAQRRLRQRDAADAAEIQDLQSALAAERRQALAGGQVTTPMEERYRQLVAAQGRRRQELVDERARAIHRTLVGSVSAPQLAQMVETSGQLARERRRAEWQAQANRFQGGPFRPGGAALDRLRDLPPAQWDQLRQAVAGGNIERMAPFLRQLIPEGRGLRGMAQPGGPGGPGPAGRRGGPGPGRPRIDLNNPQVRSAIGAMLDLAEQARSLPAPDYAAQRSTLAAGLADRFLSTMQTIRRTSGEPQVAQQEQDDDLRQFIIRYLLSSRAPVVIREKLGVPRG
ncbi:MAG: hypothetical protein HY320_04395 [Armatimonadetes bacterium]|nr:hypothetical protein [Armatimonadota bacterium]